MDEPVGISILGALLIVAAVGCLAGVLARIAFGGGVLHTLADMALGVAGAWLVTRVRPRHHHRLVRHARRRGRISDPVGASDLSAVSIGAL